MNKEQIAEAYNEILKVATQGGYKMNPDVAFCMQLTEGILKNKERYGIEACPCRLVRGTAEENLDIVCPCYYRDDDIAEYGACFCALYVGENYNPDCQIPERRPTKEQEHVQKKAQLKLAENGLAYPVWRCEVCGYLCAKQNPPGKCPICKADSKRFTRFL